MTTKNTIFTNRRFILFLFLLAVGSLAIFISRSQASDGSSIGPAAAGDLDTSFNPVIERGGTGSFGVFDMVLQPDGKMVIGGSFTSVNGVGRSRMARLNSDGSVDQNFDPDATGVQAVVLDLAPQADGKILMAGSFTTVGGVGRAGLARVNSDGSLDTTFVPNLTNWSAIKVVSPQADGKVLFGGLFDTGLGIIRIGRLNSDGSTDSTFNVFYTGAATGTDEINALAVQSDGKIVFGGRLQGVNNTTRTHIARVNADGTVDMSFNPVTGATTRILSIGLQPDGKILVGGLFTTVNGAARDGIVRLNNDGTTDTGFNPGSGLAGRAAVSFAVQSDGKILFGGNLTTYNGTGRNAIARVNSDGSLDPTFNPGTGANASVLALALQPDGKVPFAGTFTSFNGANLNRIARVNGDGSIDSSFNPGTGANLGGFVSKLALQADSKILLTGDFTAVNGAPRTRMVRLGGDGSLDPAFNMTVDTTPTTLAVQSDQKALIGGEFFTVNGVGRVGIARLNGDGSLDTSFNPGTGIGPPGSIVLALAVQPDGKILMGGAFTTVNGATRNRVARLNSNGTVDSSFTASVTGTNAAISSLLVQTDGKILLGGFFTAVNGFGRTCVARLNSDGTLDTGFDPGSGNTNSSISALAVQSDGKVLIGGNFSFFNGLARDRLARLNSDGSLDSSFASNTNPNGVTELVIQPDGKILVGGGYTAVNGTANVNRITRLNSDGTLDATFNVGSGADQSIATMARQPDGRILLGGAFARINGTLRTGIARLLGDSGVDTFTNSDTESVAIAIPITGGKLFPVQFAEL